MSHAIPSPEELKHHAYCKWHNSTSHATNNYNIFRRQVQSAINADANDAPDDEGLYMLVTQPPDEHTNNAQAANTSPPEPCANADANDVAAAEGGVPLEAEINDADPQEVHVIHDPENSKNCEGRVVA